MNEKLVIVPRITTGGKKAAKTTLFVLSCVLLLASMFIMPVLILPSIIVVCIWIWLCYFSNVEFEYTYYDGELRMAKIMNKSRRKNLADISMEDVLILAPKGDRGVYKYENDKNLKCKDLTSKSADAKVYELVAKDGESMIRYEFEPDEEMLNAMAVKYSRIITR